MTTKPVKEPVEPTVGETAAEDCAPVKPVEPKKARRWLVLGWKDRAKDGYPTREDAVEDYKRYSGGTTPEEDGLKAVLNNWGTNDNASTAGAIFTGYHEWEQDVSYVTYGNHRKDEEDGMDVIKLDGKVIAEWDHEEGEGIVYGSTGKPSKDQIAQRLKDVAKQYRQETGKALSLPDIDSAMKELKKGESVEYLLQSFLSRSNVDDELAFEAVAS